MSEEVLSNEAAAFAVAQKRGIDLVRHEYGPDRYTIRLSLPGREVLLRGDDASELVADALELRIQSRQPR